VISGGGQQNGVDAQRAVGIWILGNHATGNIVAGNLIGTNAAGSDSVNNCQDGVWINSKGNIIGGTAAGARNVISGNRWSGVCLQGGDSNVVQGNYIGTDIAGTRALANGHDGVWILYGTRNLIGGRSPAAGNVISGNLLAGVGLEGVDTSYSRGNRIEGNKIGTQTDGSSPLGNVGPGVLATSWSLDNAIGDTVNGAANLIAFNSEDGVRVAKLSDNQKYPPDPISTLISRNSIYANGGLGINLVGGTEDSYGVSINDVGDWDSGPNDLQNCPVLTSASGGNSVQIRGSLSSSANLTFTIEFFATPAEGTLKAGEGQTYLGSTTVQTDATGNAPINTTFDVPVASGRAITATATNYLNSTSEFSLPVLVTTTAIGPGQDIPTSTALLQNYPNPFNPTTRICYSIGRVVAPSGASLSGVEGPVSSKARLAVYDLLGREVAVLVDERKAPGTYEVSFDGSGLASGVYIYRMTAGSFVAVKTMLLVK
jgi:hypothetical protein